MDYFGLKIILSGFVLSLLLILPSKVPSKHVPNWLKAIVLFFGFTGFASVFVGLFVFIWCQ